MLESYARDTPTNPIHLLLENAMKEPLFMVLPHQQPQNTTESRKGCKSRRSLAHPDTLPNRCTRTSDRSGPTYLPSHHPICHPYEAYNTLPARLRYQKAVEPFDIMKLLKMESVTCNTYAALKNSECLQGEAGSGRDFPP